MGRGSDSGNGSCSGLPITGLTITVCHFPPGTSKWNKIEHRLFSHIAMNWRGIPLVNLATIVSLMGSSQSSR